ncbi:MAG: hypothetical protein KJ757_06920 [Planctomycetes bacterium]|nr:hypothetical protein [Planctomycetota bacterium]MBU1517529.1 hypothetical protein [Planctomycetota bacterium]MBU2457665.1 hypothetical protein [Planctomycetota bacterium]MBU2597271.1 hypothetical protein [Planctomycetota bacterium]
MNRRPPTIISFPVAVIIYTLFAGWLFYPYAQQLSRIQLLFLPAGSVIGAAGVFLLSRRWVLSFFASLAGGAIFGFGTFACSFYCYHPAAGLVNAFLPWFFMPAVFFYHWAKFKPNIVAIFSGLFLLLPILFVLSAYEVAAGMQFYPVPLNTTLTVQSLTGLIDPTGVKPDIFAPGFYHVSIAGLVIGFILLIRTSRIWTIILFVAAVFAAFFTPILNVPPAIWVSVPVLICSLLIAEGLEALVLSGASDSKWLLVSVAVLLLAILFNILLTSRTGVFPQSVGLYGIGVVTVLLIYFIAQSKLAWHGTRMLVLYPAIFIDIIISTRYIIGRIF